MNNNYKRNCVVLCSNTNCLMKSCPNYSKEYVRHSFYFPDCIHNPNKHNKK